MSIKNETFLIIHIHTYTRQEKHARFLLLMIQSKKNETNQYKNK